VSDIMNDSILILGGVCAYSSVHHLAMGFRQEFDRKHVLFGLICLLAVFFSAAQFAQNRAETVAEATSAVVWLQSLAYLVFLICPWFFADVTNVRPRWAIVGLNVWMATLLVVNQIQPYGVFYAEILRVDQFVLPWGEQLAFPVARTSMWFPVAFFGMISVVLFGLYALVSSYRREPRRIILGLLLAVFVFLVTLIEGVSARVGLVNLPPLGFHGFLAMIIAMGALLMSEKRQRLRASEHRFRELVQQSPYNVLRLTPSGRVIATNSAFDKFWGVTAADLAQYNILEDEQLRNKGVMPLVEQAFAGKATELPAIVYNPAENSIVPGRFNDRWVRAFIYPVLNETGKIEEITVLQEDMTEQKRIEREREKLQAQLIQSQKMESIGHLTGGIAHDFNNMLGAMLGYAELAKQSCRESTPSLEKTQRYIGEILAVGNRTTELIAQMLVFSRLSPEIKSSDVPVTKIDPVLNEVLRLLRASMPRDISVNYASADHRLRARIQPVHLHQILLNLAINARDAFAGGGQIDISLAKRHVAGVCDGCHESFTGDYVELSVSDTGSGIPALVLTKIFDPFFTTKDVGKGTGMGLSVVHGVVHGVSGHLTVQSVIGTGTTFRVFLPVVADNIESESPDVLPALDPADKVLAGRRILVVDDEHAIAAMLRELLIMHGAQVSAYDAPLKVLAAFERYPDSVDLVITDETMPGASGLDLAKAMLKIRPRLPILLCTGYSDHVNEELAKKNGLVGFVRKPVNIAQFLQLVRNCFAAESINLRL